MGARAWQPGAERTLRPVPAWMYLAFGAGAFVLHYALATRLYNLHAFQQYDVLFNADPNEGLVNLSHGWGKSEFKHPTLTYLFSPLARLFAISVKAFALSTLPAMALREQFTLFLLGALSAVRATAYLRAAQYMGLRVRSALCVAGIAFFAFSNLWFGAIPDSFALSGTCIAIAYCLALKPVAVPAATGTMRSRIARDEVWWALVFFFGAGVTVTNVIALGFLLLLYQLRRSSSKPLVQQLLVVAVVASAAVGINFGLTAVARQVLHSKTTELEYSPAIDRYTHKPSGAVVVSIARAVTNGVLAGAPAIVPLAISPGKTAWYTRAVTFESGKPASIPERLRAALVALAIVLGLMGHYRTRRHLDLLWASIAIIASNIAIHLFFGDEYVLYSLHWHCSLMAIVAGAFLWADDTPRWRDAWLVGAAALALVAGNNLFRVQSILRTVASLELPEAITGPSPGAPAK